LSLEGEKDAQGKALSMKEETRENLSLTKKKKGGREPSLSLKEESDVESEERKAATVAREGEMGSSSKEARGACRNSVQRRKRRAHARGEFRERVMPIVRPMKLNKSC